MAFKDYTLPGSESAAAAVCAICQGALEPDAATRTCDHCDATYHAECWTHNDGCGTYGCKSAPEALKLTVGDSPAEAGAWGDSKPCPRCGEELAASALRCPRCKATFDTRAPMSPEDYEAQLARKADDRRQALLASFLLAASAFGITAPVTLPLSGVWSFRKRRTARRAADTAQLLIDASVAVSLAYVGLMVAIFGFGW
jgi:hypothetical protein